MIKNKRNISNKVLSYTEIRELINDGFTKDQIKLINGWLLSDNITRESVELCMNPDFNIYQMKLIKIGLIDDKLPVNYVKFYARPDFTVDQMNTIRKSLKSILVAIDDINHVLS